MLVTYQTPLLILLSIILIERSQAGCPSIVDRSEWGARSVSGTAATLPWTNVIIHHSASNGCTSKTQCIPLVKSFQDFHVNVKQYRDIGYNFLVGEDGNVYEGRGWNNRGSHAGVHNKNSVGICIIGTFTSRVPNNAALNAVKDLIECGVTDGKIKSNYKLIGHRQVKATACPGNSLYDEIKNWVQYSSTV